MNDPCVTKNVKPSCVVGLCPLVMFAMFVISGPDAAHAASFPYPEAPRDEQVDAYFGTTVADPYRWMEHNDDPRLKTWIEAENALTQSYLRSIPFRESLRRRLTEIADYPKYSLPWTKLGKCFYFKNDGLQNQSVLYVLDTPASAPRVLLDPNTLSEDGTVSLQTCRISRNGKYLAYSLARSGSDWNEIRVLEIDGGKPLEDIVRWVKFSAIAWFEDGFFYSRYDAPSEGEELTAKNEFQKLCYHRLGTSQQDDVFAYDQADHPLRNCRASTDRDERFLFLSLSESTYGNSYHILDLTEFKNGTKRLSGAKPEDFTFRAVTDDFASEQYAVTVLEKTILMLTDRDAPNGRLVAVDPERPEPEFWNDVIPETGSLLSDVSHIGGKLVVTRLKDAADEASVHDLEGNRERDIVLPALGVCAFSGEPDEQAYFRSFTSFTYPSVIDRCEMNSERKTEWFPPAVKFRPDDFVTERIWYENSDGKKTPVFVVHKKGLVRDGGNPTLLYGYGGFNISMRPGFSAYRIPFLESGGVYAVAVLRGGGEYGETWHKSGTKMRKRNVFDDFAAAAEELIARKYTSPEKLAIQGGSNGGLLVGASVTQRPDLFRAGVAAVGVLDMLRYQKFTIGWAWATDYGTSEESREMFEYLLGYSPLHNIRSGVEYPALLITTSDHDDRVVPAHSFKFAATMQEKSTGSRPAYIRIETKAGHGAGKPVSKVIEEQTDVWAFLLDQLGGTFETP